MAVRSPKRSAIVAGSAYWFRPRNGSCQSRFGRKVSSGWRLSRTSSNSSSRSSAAIEPTSAPAEVPKIQPIRGHRLLSRSRSMKPCSISTPFIPPPERTTATSRRVVTMSIVELKIAAREGEERHPAHGRQVRDGPEPDGRAADEGAPERAEFEHEAGEPATVGRDLPERVLVERLDRDHVGRDLRR